MTGEKNDDIDDDFNFPDEGDEYQFDEGHDFGSDEDFNFDEEDFGFEEDDGGYVEPEFPAEPEETETEEFGFEGEVEPMPEMTAASAVPAAGGFKGKISSLLDLAKDPKNRKNLIIGSIAGVIVIFGSIMMFKGSDQTTTSKQTASTSTKTPALTPQKITQTTSTSTQQTAQPTVQQQAGQAPKVTMPAPVNQPKTATDSSSMASDTDLQQKDQSLLQQAVSLNAKSQEQIATLESKNAELTEMIDKLKDQNQKSLDEMKQMQESMTKLAEETQRLHKAMYVLVSSAKKQKAAAKRKVTPTRRSITTVKRSNYYVDAIIPGRAWLKDENGKTITVSIGDQISGYGKVTTIDPVNGVVTTSNGTRFEYGIQEG